MLETTAFSGDGAFSGGGGWGSTGGGVLSGRMLCGRVLIESVYAFLLFAHPPVAWIAPSARGRCPYALTSAQSGSPGVPLARNASGKSYKSRKGKRVSGSDWAEWSEAVKARGGHWGVEPNRCAA